MVKVCSRCKVEKPLKRFRFRADYPNRLHSWCIDCGNKHARETHRWLGEDRKSQMKENMRKRHLIRIFKMHEYLSAKKCQDCEMSDFRVLDFDHREGEKKISNVSKMILILKPWAKILEEIKKCDIVCGNCHKERSYRRFGYYKALRLIGDDFDNYRPNKGVYP